MPHLVKYSKADGQTGNHEVEELHEAIAYVERLRNDEGVDGAKIYRIEEVQFEFRPYYRVELGGALVAPALSTAAPVAPVASTLSTSSGSTMAFTPPSPLLTGASASSDDAAATVAAPAGDVPAAPTAPAWTPPVETTDESAPAEDAPAVAPTADTDEPASELPSVPAASLLADIEPRPMVDPWVDAPPPPAPAQPAEPATTSNGRRGLFGR